MKQYLTKKNIYIILFALLYISCAWVSIYHAIAFFGLANGSAMATMLAVTFEIGQAAVLFSLLTSKKDRSKVLPWVLMFIFTLVQVLGNVFSSYEYLMTHSEAMLKYIKEPIFIWTDIPDAQCNVILSWLLGGLLPITCLALTSMVTNFIEGEEEQKIEKVTKSEEKTEEIAKEKNDLELITDNVEELQEDIEPIFGTSREDITEQKNEIPEKTGFVNL